MRNVTVASRKRFLLFGQLVVGNGSLGNILMLETKRLDCDYVVMQDRSPVIVISSWSSSIHNWGLDYG